MECWLEVKLIADAMIPLGPEKFFKMISPNALIGGEKAQGIIFDKGYQTHLERLAEEIWSGDFFGQVSATDFEALQAKVQEFWRGQDLTRTHRELAPELYPQKQ